MRLTLKPFGPIDPLVLPHLQRELRGFDEIVIAGAAPLPEGGYSREREQYRASSLFEVCLAEPGDRILGVTEADLWDAGLNFVFGYAQIHGRVAVISLARLGGPRPGRRPDRASSGGRKLRAHRTFLDRCVKEAVHEIGHTLGLAHDLKHPDCVMHFSETLADTDRKGRQYCAECASRAEVTLTRLRT